MRWFCSHRWPARDVVYDPATRVFHFIGGETEYNLSVDEEEYVQSLSWCGFGDERRFADPDVDDITCRPKRYLGFDGGVHSDLGAMLACVPTHAVFEEMLTAVPTSPASMQHCPEPPRPTSVARMS